MGSRLRSRLIASLIGFGAILLLWSLGYQLLSLWDGSLFYWPGSIWAPYPHFYISIAIAAVFGWAAYRADGFDRQITASIAIAAALAAITQVLLPYLPRPAGIAAYVVAYAAQDVALFQSSDGPGYASGSRTKRRDYHSAMRLRSSPRRWL
jgi:hypothetical protein